MSRKTTPSSVARTLAAQLWPEVQVQRKLTKGVYAFTCAGHGGVIAVLDAADLPADGIAAARACGGRFIEVVAVHPGGRRFTSVKYVADGLRDYARQYPHVQLFECWVGEEDCDWATIALVSPAVREGMAASGYSSRVTYEDAHSCCERWNQQFLAALPTMAANQ